MLYLLADTVDASPYLQIASGFASLGFAVWYAWYATTVTIPNIVAQNSTTIANMLAEFKTELKEQRQVEASRIVASAELAKEGFKALSDVTQAVNNLRVSLKG